MLYQFGNGKAQKEALKPGRVPKNCRAMGSCDPHGPLGGPDPNDHTNIKSFQIFTSSTGIPSQYFEILQISNAGIDFFVICDFVSVIKCVAVVVGRWGIFVSWFEYWTQ